MEKEFVCDDCEAEFKIVSENTDEVTYCPYCSNIISVEDDEELTSEDEWDDQDRDRF